MKGFIKIIDHLYHFEITNGLYSLTESNIEDIKEDEIVFIGYKIDKQKIREFLILINILKTRVFT